MTHLIALFIALSAAHAETTPCPLEKTWIFAGNGASFGCGPFRDNELHHVFDQERIAARGSRTSLAIMENRYLLSLYPDERCQPGDPPQIRGSGGELVRWCELIQINGDARVEGSSLTLVADSDTPETILTYGTTTQNFTAVIRSHEGKEILELSFELPNVARQRGCLRNRIYEYFLPSSGI